MEFVIGYLWEDWETSLSDHFLFEIQRRRIPRRLLLLLSRFSRVRLCATPETAAHQAPLSLGFSRQEYWSGVPSPLTPKNSFRVKEEIQNNSILYFKFSYPLQGDMENTILFEIIPSSPFIFCFTP